MRQIRDLAEAARAYARVAKLGLESQNEAAEIKLRAERRSGEMLAQMEKNEGGRPPLETGITMIPVLPSKLEDMGITKLQSSRWQQMADLPQEQFEGHIADVRASGNELTTLGMLRFALKGITAARRQRYFDEVEDWKARGVPVRRSTAQEGVEPRLEAGEPDTELDEVAAAMTKAEVVE